MMHRLSKSGWQFVLAGVAATLCGGVPVEAHEDPPGCFRTGPALILGAFRADGVTGLVGSISECETINYSARLQKLSDVDDNCAFSGGTFTLTTPDGVAHVISSNLPCVGGTLSGEGCDPTRDFVDTGLIPYTVSPSDIVAGMVTASVSYSGGVTHDSPENSPGVASETPKSTLIIQCDDGQPCTTDTCDPSEVGSAACSNTPVVCDDSDVCTTDACNPTTGACVFTPIPDCGNDAVCRSPGFWGTHGGITQQALALAGGCVEVCGEVVTSGLASSVGSANSALEAICVSPRGKQQLQLARQLTAMALNCAVSGFGGDCAGDAALATLFGDCNAACRGNVGVGDCIAAADCFNNGGAVDPQSGLCGPDPSGSCHERALPDTIAGGRADTPQACHRARKNDCTVVLSGEEQCTSGVRSDDPESCN